MSYDHIQVNTQSSIRIEGSKVVYFDPFQISADAHDADLICITHAHYDHFDPESILKVCNQNTQEELRNWDADHRRLLDETAPKRFDVLHYAALAVLRKR